MREAYGDGPHRVKRKCKFVFIRFNDQRGHHRTRDDDFAGTQVLAKCREPIRDMAHDVDPLPRIGLRIRGARRLGAAAHDAAGEAIGRPARSRRLRGVKDDVTLIDVAPENGFGVLRRRVDIDDFENRRDARNGGGRGVVVGARRNILADVSRDGGFPPVLLQPIDFVQLWQSRRAQQQAAAPATA